MPDNKNEQKNEKTGAPGKSEDSQAGGGGKDKKDRKTQGDLRNKKIYGD